jgi:hypothetical protein
VAALEGGLEELRAAVARATDEANQVRYWGGWRHPKRPRLLTGGMSLAAQAEEQYTVSRNALREFKGSQPENARERDEVEVRPFWGGAKGWADPRRSAERPGPPHPARE